MGREIAEGLAAAHERGLIHRDIKPGNIWLDSAHKGRVKILDFGLARVGTDDVHLTRSGAIVGTPAYMSPEQARGEKVDGRTDLFSLGCVLYRLCTGVMPFAGNTTTALLMALAMDHPKSVRELNPEIPAALSDLVMRLLAKPPAERPASAREVVELIQAIENNPNGVTEAKREGISQTETIAISTSTSAPIPPRRRRTLAFALLAGAAAVVLALAGAVIYVQTDWGTLEIKTLDPDVKVLVEQKGAQVDILDPKSKQQLSVHSGQYTLKLIGADVAGLELTTDQGTGPVTLTRGGKVVVTVKRVEKPPLATTPAEGTAKAAFPPLDEAWVKLVASLPAGAQVEAVAAKLKERNPGFDGKVTPGIKDGVVTGLQFLTEDVTDISPVRALVGLRKLACFSDTAKGRLADLSPLNGMKLTELDFHGTRGFDLSPLKGMPLTLLFCNATRVSDLSPLKGMKLTNLYCGETRISELSPVKGMPLTLLYCNATRVSDLSPLKDMKLTLLYCNATLVSDMSPLKGMPLTQLQCNATRVSDLSPLKDMKLTNLDCNATRVSDLSPLKGMPLALLGCWQTLVSDLSPLKGMPLTQLYCGETRVSDLSPLKGMPLTLLYCNNTRVSDLSPLNGMKLTELDFHGTQVSDLSTLKGMPLKNLYGNFKPERDAELLRSIKTLETINDKPAAEFWKDVDGKSAEKKP